MSRHLEIARYLRIVGTAFVLIVSTASRTTMAAVVASDPLDYPDGPLGTQNGGVGWTNPWYTASNPNGGYQMVSGQVVTTFVPFSSYLGRFFANPAATPELFLSVDIRIPADIAIDDSIGLYLYTGANFTSLAMGKPQGAAEFQVGVSTFVSTGVAVSPNTAYHLVGVYDIDNSRLAMWVNPDASDYYNPTTGATTADAVIPANPGHIDSFYVATNRPFVGQLAGVALDNFVIANTPQDVGLLATAPGSCACPGDMTGDFLKDGRDVQRFAECLISGIGCDCANVDGMAGISTGDLATFISDLINGDTCP